MPFKNIKFSKARIPMNLQHFADGDPVDPPGDPQDPPGEPQTFSKEDVEKLRKEAAKYRVRAKELEANSQQQQEEAQKKQQDLMKQVAEMLGMDYNPDVELQKQLEQANAKLQEAEARNQEFLMKAQVKSAGVNFAIDEETTANLVDPEAAYMLMDKSEVKVNENGQVEGVEEALKKLASEKPYLFQVGESGTQQQQTPPKPNSFKPGPPNKSNNPKPSDPYAKGAERAKMMFQKKEE